MSVARLTGLNVSVSESSMSADFTAESAPPQMNANLGSVDLVMKLGQIRDGGRLTRHEL
jgi:hypothetical protein